MNCVLYTSQEAADFLRLSRGYLAKLRCTGEGPIFVKVGSKVLYRESDLNAFVEGRFHQNTVYSNHPNMEVQR